ncbi:MAG: cupin domain-containing protein [Dehalococcoidia bacterium]|nr:cupin domain-containing protein [Dehalococcoidia bacterium]
MERERLLSKEAEARPKLGYDVYMQMLKEWLERSLTGRVVIEGDRIPWEQSRQARVKVYLAPTVKDTALDGWTMFVQDIRAHSGRHRHQGGLSIFILEGTGYTVVDGVRHDWEEGDLLLLPVKPGGVEHQHFNLEQGKPCKWIAMIYTPFDQMTGSQYQQVQVHPDYKESP